MLSRANSGLEQKFETTQYPDPVGTYEESEVVEELVEILVDCVKKADLRGREILLRRFFFEIEKEIPLQRFLVDRLRQSKISYLFQNIPACSDEFRSETEVSTRELKEDTSEKLDRFKIKTVRVKEEDSR